MNRGGIGSASIVLIFAVLCLTIFTMISYMSALADERMVSREKDMVISYYEADVLAERILNEILSSDATPLHIFGVDITSYWDMILWAEKIYFACPVSETKELYVSALIGEDSYDILAWHMRDVGEWTAEIEWNLWSGDEDDFISSW